MHGFGGGTTGYSWKNRYYQRLDAGVDDDEHGHLSSGASKPPSWRRRRFSRRAKVVKVVPPSPPAQLLSSSTAPGRQAAASASSVVRTSRPTRHHRRRSWRIRLRVPRLAFLRRVASFPARLLRRLQHGYVTMMLRFAGAMGGAAPEVAGYSLPRPVVKEYEDKVLVEIYRALVAQGHVLVMPVAEPGPDGAVSTARLVAR